LRQICTVAPARTGLALHLLFHQPVFPPEEFAALRDHFEEKLASLPPEVRPETMDVPHFTDTGLFRWLLSDAGSPFPKSVCGKRPKRHPQKT